MNRSLTTRPSVVAGLVRALCTCCAERQELVAHPELDATRLVCRESGRTYLDRGDGLYEQDGNQIVGTVARQSSPSQPEVLSDRPARTGPKARIALERATFAAG
ncbi:MAG: hypothetical protein A2341_20310 [Deltaproteobacteria bacterium RIFOXYB12_FULL_58_9]|nr:MAG: hypothetical protein A2341_20310 [Deltaproteobacteria bacterium RIFOXYB12_FULL_58_9]